MGPRGALDSPQALSEVSEGEGAQGPAQEGLVKCTTGGGENLLVELFLL